MRGGGVYPLIRVGQYGGEEHIGESLGGRVRQPSAHSSEGGVEEGLFKYSRVAAAVEVAGLDKAVVKTIAVAVAGLAKNSSDTVAVAVAGLASSSCQGYKLAGVGYS